MGKKWEEEYVEYGSFEAIIRSVQYEWPIPMVNSMWFVWWFTLFVDLGMHTIAYAVMLPTMCMQVPHFHCCGYYSPLIYVIHFRFSKMILAFDVFAVCICSVAVTLWHAAVFAVCQIQHDTIRSANINKNNCRSKCVGMLRRRSIRIGGVKLKHASVAGLAEFQMVDRATYTSSVRWEVSIEQPAALANYCVRCENANNTSFFPKIYQMDLRVRRRIGDRRICVTQTWTISCHICWQICTIRTYSIPSRLLIRCVAPMHGRRT